MHLDDSYARALPGTYIEIEPQGFPEPQMALLNRDLAGELGLDPDALSADLFTGDRLPEGARPLAMAYAGHQFGGLVPQLGDGRAMLLGEIVAPDGRRVDLHLKGSGRTPFSRGGDGRATIGPVLREYIMGEAMYHLGIPTTRALAAVTTGEPVWRTEQLPGAVLARVAASHLRVGTFEFFAVRRDHETLEKLVLYALQRHHPDPVDNAEPARQLLDNVARVQAALIARWMHVGFVHGVMNTDNCTLSGETIDYGPCAFMDTTDPATVFSSIDHAGRYAYGRQPSIGLWNVTRFAETLIPLLHPETERAIAIAEETLSAYAKTYDAAFLAGMRAKLGITEPADDDLELFVDLLKLLHAEQLDWTSTFRRLSEALRSPAPQLLFPSALAPWIARWTARVDARSAPARMDAVNPVYVPRNHKVEEALDAAIDGDLDPVRRLLDVLAHPFTARPGLETYAVPAPEAFGPYRTFCGT